MAIILRKITDTYPQALAQGRRVRHVSYGLGTVTQGESGGMVSVRFDLQPRVGLRSHALILSTWMIVGI